MEKNLLNKIKSLRFIRVIWPLYYYLLFLLLIYIFRGAFSPGIILNFVVTCGFLFPIVITVWITLLFRKNYKEKTLILSFLYCLLPGFIFGFDFAYGFSGLEKEYEFLTILPALLYTGICCAIITGLIGLIINFTINLIKRT